MENDLLLRSILCLHHCLMRLTGSDPSADTNEQNPSGRCIILKSRTELTSLNPLNMEERLRNLMVSMFSIEEGHLPPIFLKADAHFMNTLGISTVTYCTDTEDTALKICIEYRFPANSYQEKSNRCCLLQLLTDLTIQDILHGGGKVDKVVTYNTFVYHGSSGSPVFDAHGRVFGLHSADFVYKETDTSVIYYAHPLIAIFKTFVIHLNQSINYELLERVKKEVEENIYLLLALKEALESVSDDEPSDTEEPMDTS